METKSLNLFSCELKFSPEIGIFSGYGSVFNVEDGHKDIVMPGAFDDVIKSGNPIKVYVNHGWMRDELPVGQWHDLKSDETGLFGHAKLETRMPRALDAYWATRSGLVEGLSIGYALDKNGFDVREGGGRTIHKFKYLKEISIVENASNKLAKISDIKSSVDLKNEIDELVELKDFEHFLRESGNLSRSNATYFIRSLREKILQSESGDNEDAKQIMNRINKILEK